MVFTVVVLTDIVVIIEVVVVVALGLVYWKYAVSVMLLFITTVADGLFVVALPDPVPAHPMNLQLLFVGVASIGTVVPATYAPPTLGDMHPLHCGPFLVMDDIASV